MSERAADSLAAPRLVYSVECRGPDGALKWREAVPNLVTTAGKTDLIERYFRGSAYTAAWYLGLIAGAAPTLAAGDTLAAHAGWTESAAYAGNRPALSFAAAAAGSSTATAIVFTMTGAYTVSGAFVCTAASGTTGTLYSESAFSAVRAGGAGDTITVTVTQSAS
jgi:hypothetical protein